MRCFFSTLTVSRAKSDCLAPAGSVPLSGRSSKVSATLSFADRRRRPLQLQEQRAAARQARQCLASRDSSLQQAAQHPRGLFVNLQALGQQVAGRFVAGLFRGREGGARGARHGLVTATNNRTMSRASGTPSVSSMDVSFANSLPVPGAG